ncbi:MAG: amidohydrolase family protein [Trueperaceae bacterium]
MNAFEILDAHTHVGSAASTWSFSDHDYTAEELVDHMDRCGVTAAVLMGGGRPDTLPLMNERCREAVSAYPHRFFGFVRVHPYLPAWEAELELYVMEHGFRGIKLHPTQDAYEILDFRVDRVMERAAAWKLPVMVHSGTIPYAMPGQIADLAARHPDVTVIMAHAGSLELYQHAIPSAQRVSNLILEFSMLIPSAARRAIDAIGADRVLYGSNWPATSMRTWIETVKSLPTFTDLEKANLMGRNLRRLIDASGPSGSVGEQDANH